MMKLLPVAMVGLLTLLQTAAMASAAEESADRPGSGLRCVMYFTGYDTSHSWFASPLLQS